MLCHVSHLAAQLQAGGVHFVQQRHHTRQRLQQRHLPTNQIHLLLTSCLILRPRQCICSRRFELHKAVPTGLSADNPGTHMPRLHASEFGSGTAFRVRNTPVCCRILTSLPILSACRSATCCSSARCDASGASRASMLRSPCRGGCIRSKPVYGDCQLGEVCRTPGPCCLSAAAQAGCAGAQPVPHRHIPDDRNFWYGRHQLTDAAHRKLQRRRCGSLHLSCKRT